MARPPICGDRLAGQAHGVNVQAAVRLVEDGELRPQQGHLQDLRPLHLPARKTVVHVAPRELAVDPQPAHLLAQLLAELPHGDQLFALVAVRGADVRGRVAEEVGHLHAGNGHGTLKGEEQSGAGPLVRLHRQHVLPVKVDRPAGHFISGMAHDREAQRALARAVGAHQGVDLAAADLQTHALENRLARHRNVKIANPQRLAHGLTFW